MALTAPPLHDVEPAGPRWADPTGPAEDLPAPPARRRRLASSHRHPQDPAWARPALLALLAGTAVPYLWGLGASGWANSFYSAAAQAGSQSWKAFFFGSSDAANFITVDKPPAALWAMGLSVRLFGLNAWSILVPEALMGVASVGVLHLTVKRWFGPGAGLLAGAVMALTPVAVLMFRFNNPDALLVLVLTLGAYCTTRAVEVGRGRWLYLAFALVGLGFLTKMLQAVLVLPAFGLVYLVAAPNPLRRRLGQLVVATAAFVASCGWWIAVVELLPASARPYVGGSQDNSVVSLIFGYNGFGRLTGNETGSVGGGGAGGNGTGMWGATGWLRLFNSEFGGQASWLLPAALALLVAGLALTVRSARVDRTRAALILWGGWLVVTGATFSLGQGIIHPYYTVALAPALGALIGIGGVLLWRRRHELAARIGLAVTVAVTAWWTLQLLGRSPNWNPWLQPVVVASGVIGTVGVLAAPFVGRTLRTAVVAAALVTGLAAPAAASIATAAAVHAGAIPSASPTVTGGGFGGLGGGPGGGFNPGRAGGPTGGRPNGGPPNGGRPTGAGGILQSSLSSAELTAALQADAGRFTWVAVTIGANQAAGYQLASAEPVMAIGGFNGSDPWPTLAVFQHYVAAGRIHYFITGGGFGGGGGGNGASSEITAWVETNFTATTIGGTTVYDLTT